MRRVRTVFLVLVFSFFLVQLSLAQKKSKIKWYSFEEAIALNEENPKKVFIDIYTDWCGWCTKMDNTTFSDPVIAEYMNKNYYPVKMDAETKDTIVFKDKEYVNNQTGRRPPHELAIALLQGKMSYPSYAFLDENNDLITVVKGYIKAHEFEPMIHFLSKDAYKKGNFTDFKSSFKSNLN